MKRSVKRRKPRAKRPRVVVELDDRCSAMVRQISKRGSDTVSPALICDLVNAAVEFFGDDSDEGISTQDFVEMAKARRLAQKSESPGAQVVKPKHAILGRYGQSWFSREYLSWCKRHRLKPGSVADCILHTLALRNPNGVTIRSDAPLDDSEMFEPGEEAT